MPNIAAADARSLPRLPHACHTLSPTPLQIQRPTPRTSVCQERGTFDGCRRGGGWGGPDSREGGGGEAAARVDAGSGMVWWWGGRSTCTACARTHALPCLLIASRGCAGVGDSCSLFLSCSLSSTYTHTYTHTHIHTYTLCVPHA